MKNAITKITIATTLTATFAIAQQPVEKTGQWLYDYGFNYAQSITDPNETDAQFVLTWFKAAAEVSPDLADAYLGQYDLLTRLGKTDQALTALENYCNADPKRVNARLDLITTQFENKQTAEDRIALCEKYLKIPNLPDEVASDLYRRLAELLFNRGETEQARAYVNNAITASPCNLTARALIAEMNNQLLNTDTQVDLLLDEIAANPASPDTPWQLAKTLDSASLHAQAQNWYDIAADNYKKLNPQSTLPLSFLMDRARSLRDGNDVEKAFLALEKILAAHPSLTEATMLLIPTAIELGKKDFADKHTAALDSHFREMEAHAEKIKSAVICHQLARFHIEIKPDERRALHFATLADEFQPGNTIVRTTLGIALIENQKFEEAINTLEPLAAANQRAAFALARAYQATSKTDKAISTLHAAEKLKFSGNTYRDIVNLLQKLDQKPTPKPELKTITKRLETFNREIFQFPANAAEFLDFNVKLVNPNFTFSTPLLAEISVTNNAPYDITFGHSNMVRPRITVSVKEKTFKGAFFPDYLVIAPNLPCTLAPGEIATTTETITTTAAKMLAARQPQKPLKLEFSFTLDPANTGETPAPSVFPNFKQAIATAQRIPVDATQAGLQKLAQTLKKGSTSEKLTAIDTILALIIERNETFTEKVHTYAAEKVDTEILTAQIQNAINDPEPIVSAKAMWALAFLPQNDRTIQKAVPMISSKSPICRLLATEMFAKLQGPVFLPVLENLAKDPNPLVSQLATLYRDQAKTN